MFSKFEGMFKRGEVKPEPAAGIELETAALAAELAEQDLILKSVMAKLAEQPSVPDLTDTVEAAALEEATSPYASPEALGVNLQPLKESQVQYPGADKPRHTLIEAQDVAGLGRRAANPHGFPEAK